jgi:hypothetical protein
MIEIRPFAELGRFENDWLAALHHFSFGHSHDPARDGVVAAQEDTRDIVALEAADVVVAEVVVADVARSTWHDRRGMTEVA